MENLWKIYGNIWKWKYMVPKMGVSIGMGVSKMVGLFMENPAING